MFIVLHLASETRRFLLPNSMLVNFDEIEYFYFKVPRFSSRADMLHLTEQARTFFREQFSDLNVSMIEVHSDSLWQRGIKSKELSWDIFFQFGKFVKVKKGIFDENLRMDISDFIGKIVDFYNDGDTTIFLISFSGESLKKISIKYFKSNTFQISPFFSILEPEFLLPLPYISENNFEDRDKLDLIAQILGIEDLMIIEELDLEKSFLFWTEKIQSEKEKINQTIVDTEDYSTLTWKDISFSDKKYGLWGTFVNDTEEFELPLFDIINVKEHEKLNDILDQYKDFMFYLYSG